jgi:ABC-type multidrug transport system ATPase subunit
MLQLRDVAKAYAKLERISLDVAAGEIVLLVGKNGAGKTTLLRIATGYVDPDAGTVTVDGRFGYLPEHAPVPVELTPREHLRLRAGLKRARDVDRVLDATNLRTEADKPIGLLSKGYRQRVGLADAMLGAPPLLVLDEPTSGLDPVQTRELVETLRAATCAILISSHAVADLGPLATRVAVLARGAITGLPAGDGLEAKVLELL